MIHCIAAIVAVVKVYGSISYMCGRFNSLIEAAVAVAVVASTSQPASQSYNSPNVYRENFRFAFLSSLSVLLARRYFRSLTKAPAVAAAAAAFAIQTYKTFYN